MSSPLDYHVDALLSTLDACEKSRSDRDCKLYVEQLSRFSHEYGALFPTAESARRVRGAVGYYTKIRARTCAQIRFDDDRAMLKSVYGPVGAAGLVMRRWLSV